MALASLLDLRPQTPEQAGPLANIEAEQAVLGILLYDNAALESVGDLQPSQLFESFHGELLSTIRAIVAAGSIADPSIVHTRVKADPRYAELGGARYLGDLVDRSPPAANVGAYVAEIIDHALRRDLVREGTDLAKRAALDAGASALEIIANAERELATIASAGPAREAWRSAAEVIASALDSAEARNGAIDVCADLSEVDEHIGGFGYGELSLFASRPGMGKSTVASQIAKANAKQGKGTVVFSLEMGVEPLGLRLACDLAWDGYDHALNPTYYGARRNQLTTDQRRRLRNAKEIVDGWPLLLDTRPGLTVSTMEACALRAYRRWEKASIPRGPLIVDHLGIVRPEKQRQGSKHAEVADVSRSLAEMAKRLDVPVIAMCQLNRGVESREDKRPGLADLRQAGELEEDARLVVFLYRPEYYFRAPQDPHSETAEQRVERENKLARQRNKLFWLIEKNNNGPLGQVETYCDIACSVVRDRTELWGR